MEKLAAATKKLKVGPGLEEGTQQGPLIDGKAVEKVEELIDDARAKGGKVVAGGKRHALGGSFFEPTVIAEAKPEMRFMKEEILGRSRQYSASRRKMKRSSSPMTPNSGLPAISTPEISAGLSA